MTKLEEVARTICRAEMLMVYGPENWREGELEIRVCQYWHRHMPAARLVMKALRDPTEAMRRAMTAALLANPEACAPGWLAWQTGIDAVLEDAGACDGER
jgi:hypothetical protein